MAKYKNGALHAFMNLTKALADENRVRMLMTLRDGELCVCQITEVFRLAPSTVSKHLSILHQAGLVVMRKHGRWIYYRLPGAGVAAEVRWAIDWVAKFTEREPRVLKDAENLKRILKVDPSELCKRQGRK